MAMKELVQEINAELRALHTECETQRENPALIRVISALVRLTDDPEVVKPEQQQDAQPAGAMEAEAHGATNNLVAISAQPCKHIINVYGLCTKCGHCTHAYEKDGHCIACGEAVTVSAT